MVIIKDNTPVTRADIDLFEDEQAVGHLAVL